MVRGRGGAKIEKIQAVRVSNLFSMTSQSDTRFHDTRRHLSSMRTLILIASLLAHSAHGFQSGLHATPLSRARTRVRHMTLSMQQQSTLAGGTKDWQQAVGSAQARAAAVKSDQDATTSAMAVVALGFFNLPLTDNVVADVLLSILVGGGFGFLAGFNTSPVGGAVRSLGSATGTAVATVDGALGISEKVQAASPEGGFSYANIKKYGVAGTLAYVLTELAFWAVAFPVASTTFYNVSSTEKCSQASRLSWPLGITPIVLLFD